MPAWTIMFLGVGVRKIKLNQHLFISPCRDGERTSCTNFCLYACGNSLHWFEFFLPVPDHTGLHPSLISLVARTARAMGIQYKVFNILQIERSVRNYWILSMIDILIWSALPAIAWLDITSLVPFSLNSTSIVRWWRVHRGSSWCDVQRSPWVSSGTGCEGTRGWVTVQYIMSAICTLKIAPRWRMASTRVR